MGEGYYIYEPLRLSRALAIQVLHELLIEFLDSLINEMYLQLSLTRSMVIVEMIEVTYCGSYPAIGIKNCDDLLFEKVVRFFDSIVEDELD